MHNVKKIARRGQKSYNQRTWSSTLQPGDHVLVRNLTHRGGPGKLRNYWKDAIHVVRGRKGPDGPVYVVEPLQGTGRKQVYTVTYSCYVLTWLKNQRSVHTT